MQQQTLCCSPFRQNYKPESPKRDLNYTINFYMQLDRTILNTLCKHDNLNNS